MRALALVLLLAVAGCSTGDRLTAVEGLTITAQAVKTTAQTAEAALDEGHIDVATACRIHQYGQLALRLVREGVLAWVQGSPGTAAEHLTAARDALRGVSEEAAALVAQHCAGE